MLDIFRISDTTELTDSKLLEYIRKNDNLSAVRYQKLWKAYNNEYEIFKLPAKAAYKPDNRISVNFASFITNIFCGFANFGNVKIDCNDEAVLEYIRAVDEATDSNDINSELTNICSVFGRAYRIAYVDEDGTIGTAYLDPMESFAIYNESITPKIKYFIRTYKDDNNVRHGSISDDTYVRYFTMKNGITWDGEPILHGFNTVPAIEFMLNRHRKGLFEDVMPLINAYNKALSEKANDVDYFADAYLKVLGAKVDEETVRFMRENRTINIAGSKGSDVVVDFLQKPSSDTTQENLLSRMETMIFSIAMVCNISDENFATSSGIALKYKMLPMIQLAEKAWSKFQTGLKSYYKLICSNPITPLQSDDWVKIKLTHNLNYPANNLDEAQTAQTLQGIVSKQTQLSVLSIVDDVNDEIKRLNAEDEVDDSLDRVIIDEESITDTEQDIQDVAIGRADSPISIAESIRNRAR